MSKKSRRYNTPEFNFVPEDLISYNSNFCLQTLCSADDILERIKYDSGIIFKNLKRGILDVKDILPQDENCLCKLGWGERPFVNKQTCVGCELFRRICSSVKIPESKIINIEAGKYLGKSLKFKEYDILYDGYFNNNELIYILKKLTRIENELNLLDSSTFDIYNKTIILSTRSYITNYILACVFINNKLQKYKIHPFMLFDWSYSCANKVYTIETNTNSFIEISTIEALQKIQKTPMAQSKVNPLTKIVVISILKQLVSFLHFASKYSFIHGNPCIDAFKFQVKPCSYKYNDVLIESPVTLFIEPSLNVSFGYETDDGQNIRLVTKQSDIVLSHNNYPLENVDLMVNPKKKNVYDSKDIPMINELTQHLIYSYKIGNKLNTFIDLTVNNGIPLLNNSFEFYCFVIALACEDSFYSTFIEHDALRTVWYSLWKITEYETMSSELSKLRKLDKVENKHIINFLSNFTLRSDALKFFWDSICNM